jgi:hypothetical protein
VYWTNFSHTPTGCHQATVLCRSAVDVRYPDSGPRPEARSGEDDVFCRELQSRGRVCTLRGSPELYLYVSHGLNSMGRAHHTMLVTSLAVSNRRVQRRQQALCAALCQLAISPLPITVMGRDGPVFLFDANSR